MSIPHVRGAADPELPLAHAGDAGREAGSGRMGLVGRAEGLRVATASKLAATSSVLATSSMARSP